ncbi:MAG: hypothetical protein ACOYEW_01675 [Anaerolineae bacterium]|jgi:hypothetical protein
MADREMESVAKAYLTRHFPNLQTIETTHTKRQAKTPGAPCQHVFDFTGTIGDTTQRVRIVLDDRGQVVKAAISR